MVCYHLCLRDIIAIIDIHLYVTLKSHYYVYVIERLRWVWAILLLTRALHWLSVTKMLLLRHWFDETLFISWASVYDIVYYERYYWLLIAILLLLLVMAILNSGTRARLLPRFISMFIENSDMPSVCLVITALLYYYYCSLVVVYARYAAITVITIGHGWEYVIVAYINYYYVVVYYYIVNTVTPYATLFHDVTLRVIIRHDIRHILLLRLHIVIYCYHCYDAITTPITITTLLLFIR